MGVFVAEFGVIAAGLGNIEKSSGHGLAAEACVDYFGKRS